jgi:hypothetical protein
MPLCAQVPLKPDLALLLLLLRVESRQQPTGYHLLLVCQQLLPWQLKTATPVGC